ncbi:BapA/Bap/LapF family large adhesin, partial [Pseudomonas typographi]|uniref:BapA/Bap/LapF family large adhesin n=1 Tax=Pseudomonas typographi TaxID=2715964 RepID=UPI001EEDB37F
PDLTAPAAPVVTALIDGGLVLTGTGEANATVSVGGASGALGSALVASNGTFSVSLTSAQLNGEVLTLVQTDAAGNASVPVSYIAADVTAPLAPTLLAYSADSSQLAGAGEAGATVRVSAGGTLIGSGQVAANGRFLIVLSPSVAPGDSLVVVLQDAAGNTSPATDYVVPNGTLPDAPVGLALSSDGLTLTGTAQVGTTVAIYGPAGTLLGSASTALDGTFSVALQSAQLNGELLQAIASANGADSVPTSFTAPDVTTPAAVTDLAVNASGTQLTGHGEAGATVTVCNAAGTVLGTAIVAANGSFFASLAPAQANGQVLSAAQQDGAGNTSASTSVNAPDITPPAQATALVVAGDGLSLTGTGEAGATATVRGADGTVLGSGPVGSNGQFSVTLGSAQIDGELLSVTLADAHGNVSTSASVTAPDIDVNTPVVATDNLATAEVTIVPVTNNRTYTDSFTTLLAGFSKTFNFSVAAGTEVDPTLTLSTSSAVSLLDGVVYTLQVKDASGNWVSLDVNGNSGLLDLLALAGQGMRVHINTLLAGDYRLIVSSTGIGVLTTVNTSLAIDTTSLTQFNGVAGAAITGNVITDPGVNGNADITGPDHGAVLTVLKNGSYVAPGSGTVVEGLYGTLTLNATGAYIYTPNGTLASVGKVDVFSYTLTHANGLTSTAHLYVRIDSPQATEVWNSNDLAAAATLIDATNDVASSALTLAPLEVTSTSVLGTLSLPLIGSASASYNISVASGAVSDLTVSLSASNVLSLLSSLTLSLYQQNTAGAWVLVRSYGGSSLLALGGGNYGMTFEDQPSGNYQVRLSGGGISVASSVTASLTNVATYASQLVVHSYTAVTGNLLTDTAGAGADVLGSPFTVLSVLLAGNYVVPGNNGTSIAGTYGTLWVKADGTYSYTLNNGLDSSVVGQQDVFSYELTHPSGATSTATLTVDLTQAATTASISTFATLALADDTAASQAAVAASSQEQVLQGTDGNDTLDGSHGGAVTLQGGAGNDTLIIADQHFTSVDGGSGTDTLLWAGGDATINLSDLAPRIHNIEIFDLNSTTAVKLSLSLADLLAVTEADHGTLQIKGNSQDSVHMSGAWNSDGAAQAEGVEYAQFTPQEDATHHLWVQNGIHVV